LPASGFDAKAKQNNDKFANSLMAAMAKRAIYGMLQLGGIYRYARYAHRNQALILTYHGVLRNGSDSYVNRNCVDVAVFERQMRWLKQNYRVLSLSRLLDGLQGKADLPQYAAAITFDDGFRNNYTAAFPVLVRLGLPATIFVTTNYIGSKNALLWTEKVDALIYSAAVRSLRIQMNGSSMEFEVTSPNSREVASDRIRAYLKKLNPS